MKGRRTERWAESAYGTYGSGSHGGAGTACGRGRLTERNGRQHLLSRVDGASLCQYPRAFAAVGIQIENFLFAAVDI